MQVCGTTYRCILLYADDIALLAPSAENLQSLLDIVFDWCQKFRMSINEEKTNIVHFRRKSEPQDSFGFSFGDTVLNTVDKYKYLGCVLNEFLDYSCTMDILAESSSRALASIINTSIKESSLPFKTFTKLYNSCVVPVMDYCAGVWGYPSFDKPQVVQNRALRSFLGVHRFTSTAAVSGDTGWIPPVVRRHVAMVALWCRLLRMDESRLTKRVFQWDWNHKGKTWSYNVRGILRKCNIPVPDSVSAVTVNRAATLALVEGKLFDIHKSKWAANRLQQSKLKIYNMYKVSYSVEPYVEANLPRSQRSLIARLRSGTLPLNIETMRFGLFYQPEDRLCTYCKKIEDENHFVFDCKLFENIRLPFFSTLGNDFLSLTKEEQWNIFMSKHLIYKFANYIQKIFHQRQLVLSEIKA